FSAILGNDSTVAATAIQSSVLVTDDSVNCRLNIHITAEQNAHPRVVVELGRHQHEHVANDRHRDDEDDLLPERNATGAEHHHDNAEYYAAAENPPIDRPPFHGFGAAQEHAGDRNRWDNQADYENVLARHGTGEPAGEAGDSEDASRHREPTH